MQSITQSQGLGDVRHKQDGLGDLPRYGGEQDPSCWVRLRITTNFTEALHAQSILHRCRGHSMKRLVFTSSILFFILAFLFANPLSVLAKEGDGGHELEAEVNGYHVTLASQSEWSKGENTIVVTLADSMGMPLSNANVEILIAPKSDEHVDTEMDAPVAEAQQNSMPGMDMGEPVTEASDMAVHNEEIADPVSMMESEHGMYIVETHLESSGEHDVQVMFHVNGEMLQADFIVEIPGTGSKTIVLWSFVLVNIAVVASAGIMKKQTVTVKGGQ